MDINPGEEFRIKATPSAELLRKLAYLAAQDNDSVLTGALKPTHGSSKDSGSDKARRAADVLRMARLADPQYQALSLRINNELDLMDEASVHALQGIEQELAELQQEREQMLAQAYRDEEGNAIFMAEDEGAAYYEDGSEVDGEKFARVKGQLGGRPTWDGWRELSRTRDELLAERDEIHRHEAERQKLREDLAEGAIAQKEAAQREQKIEDSMPDRVRSAYDVRKGRIAEKDAAPVPALSAEEEAALDARESQTHGSEHGGSQPATGPRVPFQPG